MKRNSLLFLFFLLYLIGYSKISDYSFYQISKNNYKYPFITSAKIKNVIYYLVPGLGFNQLESTRIGNIGVEKHLYVEKFPYCGYLHIKGRNNYPEPFSLLTEFIYGINSPERYSGIDKEGRKYTSLLEIAHNKGLKTGFITTDKITGFYCAPIFIKGNDSYSYTDIFNGIVDSKIDLVIAGKSRILNNSFLKMLNNNGYILKKTLNDFLSYTGTEKTIALISEGPMLFTKKENDFSLILSKALKLLENNNGFLLVIVDNRIMLASSANDTKNLYREVLSFDMNIKTLANFAQRNKETLVVVSSICETGGLNILNENNTPTLRWNTNKNTFNPVPLFSFGPYAHIFSCIKTPTKIPYIISQLLNLGKFPLVSK